jgi:RNA polymerase primary sigma factor
MAKFRSRISYFAVGLATTSIFSVQAFSPSAHPHRRASASSAPVIIEPSHQTVRKFSNDALVEENGQLSLKDWAKQTKRNLRTTTNTSASNRRRKQKSSDSAAPTTMPTTTNSQSPAFDPATPGLTKEEEAQYSFQIRTLSAALALREQLVTLQDGMHVHPTHQEWAAACGVSAVELRRVLDEGQQARAALVAANLGLVTALAKRQLSTLQTATEAGRGVGTILTLQDLIQEGTLGLMKAAERFEPERGWRFSTYATWWVRQRILKSVSDSSRTIRLPAHVHGTLQRIQKAKAWFRAHGEEATLSSLAQYLELPVEKVRLYTDSSRNVMSLETPLKGRSAFKDENTRTLGDTLASDEKTPEEDVEAQALRLDLEHVMTQVLTGVEQNVLRRRFGLEDGTCWSVEETARQLGVSRDRIRLVETRALNKLRHPQQNYKLQSYVGDSNHVWNHRVADTEVDSVSTTTSTESVSTESAPHGISSDRIWFF